MHLLLSDHQTIGKLLYEAAPMIDFQGLVLGGDSRFHIRQFESFAEFEPLPQNADMARS